MHALLLFPLAVSTGFPWMNFVWVILSIAALMLAVRAVGRWAAATHPHTVPAARPKPVEVTHPVAEAAIAAVIAGAVHEALGPLATITAISPQAPKPAEPSPPASVESLMLAWSLEGRRQIYTSHKVR